MKMRLACIMVCFTAVQITAAQSFYIDSLKRQIRISQSDTAQLVLLGNVARIYAEINPDSAYYFAEKLLQLSRQLHFSLEEGNAMREMGYALLNRGNYPRALQMVLSALAILENPKSEQKVLVAKFPGDDEILYRTATPHHQRLSSIAFAYQNLALLYVNSNNYEKALEHHLKAKRVAEESGNKPLQSIINMTAGRVYLSLQKPDSALNCLRRAYDLVMQAGYKRYLGSIFLNIARTYLYLKNTDSAMLYFRQALDASHEHYYFRGVAASNLAIANLHQQTGNRDSTLYYLRAALQATNNLAAPDLYLRSYNALAAYYKSAANNDSTVKYQSLIINLNDSLFNAKQAQEFQNIDFDEQQRKQQIEAAKAEYRSKIQIYLLLGGLGIFFLIAVLLWRNSSQRKKANTLLSRQKKELESTLNRLKTTQNQLIQSEKMASLGELTAGIAHEIQNPLNFVNNFSEVNAELAIELQQELVKGNMDAAIELARNIKENEEKINHHGKRADSIVKSMLQHSRSGSGKKEFTDINKLVDECLRLSYHGLRAKDKSFQATFKTDLDPGLPKIGVVPEEIGRVFLNLINNAFYSVNEKMKMAGRTYQPTVTITTKLMGNKAEIKVNDNGNGIPESVKEKIFQPFFTTKPTGQGTGLGLSLSYDIITKGHHGELKVNSVEGEYAEFVIILPINPLNSSNENTGS